MCILFLYVSNQPKADGYKLILGANRDESYARPAKAAHIWEGGPWRIGGTDMEPGREGGTWLGMSEDGKIGVLLNIFEPSVNTVKSGRGSIVSDYLRAHPKHTNEFFEELKSEAEQYNLFNLVTIELKTNGSSAPSCLKYYTNEKGEGQQAPSPVDLEFNGCYGFGNSHLNTPFKKVSEGRKQLNDLVQECGSVTLKDQLIQGVVKILKSTEKHHPDQQLFNQASSFPPLVLEGLSSTFVKINTEPLVEYGTRTHTVILVDANDRVEFHEWTLNDPIDYHAKPDDQTYTYSKFNFIIKDEQRSGKAS